MYSKAEKKTRKRDNEAFRRSQYLRIIYNAVRWHEMGRVG